MPNRHAVIMAQLAPVRIAYCPYHGLHGARERCFECDLPAEQIEVVAKEKYDYLTAIATRYERALKDIADGKVPGVTFAEPDLISGFAAEALSDQPRLADDSQWREAVLALDGALGAALTAIEAFIDGHGPRGAELLPLIDLSQKAADARDKVMGNG